MKELRPVMEQLLPEQRPIYIAGPCSVETEEQTLATAYELAKGGIKIFRGGIWKPRTKPGCFEGVGSKGLPWLTKVKKETGMLVATEIATDAHLRAALDAGVDIIWIGARTTANPFAIQEIADAICNLKIDIPVLVKNPVSPDIELWIGAIERFYNAGLRHIGAIHRGFSGYGPHLYRNNPEWRIPIELRRRYPVLTVLSDPSHIGGKREFVNPLAQQALDMGFDGLMIESHINPEYALSDKNQQVTTKELLDIISSLEIKEKNASTESLRELRREIDRLDDELIDILAQRMNVSQEIGRYKLEHKMQVVQLGRFDDMLKSREATAEEMGLSATFINKILSAIHEESVRKQIEISNEDKI